MSKNSNAPFGVGLTREWDKIKMVGKVFEKSHRDKYCLDGFWEWYTHYLGLTYGEKVCIGIASGNVVEDTVVDG